MPSPIELAENALRQQSLRGRKDPKIAAELVHFLEDSLRRVEDNERYLVFLMLLGEHADHRRFMEAEDVILKITHECSDEPLAWIEIANHYLYVRQDNKKALNASSKGVETARKKGSFVVHALNTQCRIARKLEDYDLLANSIADLIAFKNPPNTPDSAYECDFLANLPEGSIDSRLISSLKELCEQKSRSS